MKTPCENNSRRDESLIEKEEKMPLAIDNHN